MSPTVGVGSAPVGRRRGARERPGPARWARAGPGRSGPAGRDQSVTGGGAAFTLDAIWAAAGSSEIGSMPSIRAYVEEELVTCIPSDWSCASAVLKSVLAPTFSVTWTLSPLI